MLPRKAAHHFRALGLAETWEVSVVLTDNEAIAALNARWRGIDEATDVLSFPLYSPQELAAMPPIGPLGDIVISLPYAESTLGAATHRDRVAEALGADIVSWELADEVHFLFIHGLLHLLGHDHLEPEQEAIMRAEEKRLWLAAQG